MLLWQCCRRGRTDPRKLQPVRQQSTSRREMNSINGEWLYFPRHFQVMRVFHSRHLVTALFGSIHTSPWFRNLFNIATNLTILCAAPCRHKQSSVQVTIQKDILLTLSSGIDFGFFRTIISVHRDLSLYWIWSIKAAPTCSNL